MHIYIYMYIVVYVYTHACYNICMYVDSIILKNSIEDQAQFIWITSRRYIIYFYRIGRGNTLQKTICDVRLCSFFFFFFLFLSFFLSFFSLFFQQKFTQIRILRCIRELPSIDYYAAYRMSRKLANPID
jgi:hypothetical protein